MIRSAIDIRKALLADSTVTALVSNVTQGYCISVDIKEPEWFPVDGTTITIYKAGIDDKTLPYSDQTWTINCRAETYKESEVLAETVSEALNRLKINGISGRAYCQLLATLPPADESDNYNTPVECQVKRRAYA